MPDSNDPLLQIKDLSVTFGEGRRQRGPQVRAVDGISLDVRPGQIVAIVGESGSGKSMTGRAVLGLLPHTARATGSIELAGTQVIGATEKTLNGLRGAVASLVFQEPQTALNPVQTIGRQLVDALRLRSDIGAGEARTRAAELLRRVGIPEPERRLDWFPDQLSGGQKQRVVIALALSGDPDLIIADEPTTALDVTVQAEILTLLRRLRDETGKAILLITHNLGVVAETADAVVVMQNGRIVERAGTGALFASPRADYTRELMSAVPRLDTTGGEASEFEPVKEAGNTLQLDDISVVFGGRGRAQPFSAVDGVSLELRPGEVLGLVGESGSGKTTLGRVALGLTPPSGGRVRLIGQDHYRLGVPDLRRLRREVALVPQDPATSLDPRWSVEQCIGEPLRVHRAADRAGVHRRVTELLDAVHLPTSLAARRPGELSGGQRQRVALARALALSPRLVVADEPTSALDVSVQARVLDLFNELRDEFEFSCLFISHDLAVIGRIADRVAVLEHGRIVETGPVGSVFSRPRAPYTRTLLSAVPVPDPAARRPTDNTSDNPSINQGALA